MFKLLYKLIKENNNIDIQSNVDITKPGEVGKIILNNNNLYIYDGTGWISFVVQKTNLNILDTTIPFGGLTYQNTQNGIKYYKKPGNDINTWQGQTWAGVIFFKSNINMITPDIHKISVYVISPKDNVNILLKIENKNNSSIYQQINSTLLTKNKLTKLTFDFDGTTGNIYDLICIFFDFEQLGDNSIYGLGNYSIY